jgi:hypothetical protein
VLISSSAGYSASVVDSFVIGIINIKLNVELSLNLLLGSYSRLPSNTLTGLHIHVSGRVGSASASAMSRLYKCSLGNHLSSIQELASLSFKSSLGIFCICICFSI